MPRLTAPPGGAYTRSGLDVNPLPLAPFNALPPTLSRSKTSDHRSRRPAILFLAVAAGIVPGGVAILSLVWLVSTGDGRNVLKWALAASVGVLVWL